MSYSAGSEIGTTTAGFRTVTGAGGVEHAASKTRKARRTAPA
jgi:hypothetical protein